MMTTSDETTETGDTQRVQALQALADILERALDRATSVVLMRHVPEVCTVYLGDPSGAPEELRKVGTLPREVADEMLKLTSSGLNRVQIGDQLYRFARTFTQVNENAAVVLSI
ncbi:hypothetical protein [Caballeronia sp. LZ065]|uniref:hypothetical protein n=1 Tax=Caballeronia sp. LZ065 TaxID=3038571 RepID=UPI00286B9B05|nr:hypothetical protein [Caballeronia sp. LZ065]